MSFQDFLLWYDMRKGRGSLSLNMLLYGCHVGTCTPPKSKGHQHGNSIQSSINLGETLLRIMYRWKTADWLFIHQSSITSQILDFIYWMVMIFSFDHMTGENHVLNNQLPASNQPLAILHPAFKFPPLPNPRHSTDILFDSTNFWPNDKSWSTLNQLRVSEWMGPHVGCQLKFHYFVSCW